MKVNVILACDTLGGIGLNGNLPWKIPKDYQYYLQQSKGNIRIAGRTTVLDHMSPDLNHHAHTLVLTRNIEPKADFRAKIEQVFGPERTSDNFELVSSIPEALESAKNHTQKLNKPLFIEGGATVYNKVFAEKLADFVFVTEIKQEFKCDTFVDLAVLKQNYAKVDSLTDLEKVESQMDPKIFEIFVDHQTGQFGHGTHFENGVEFEFCLYVKK